NNAGTVVGAGAGTTGAFLWSNGALSSLPRIQDSTAGGAEAFDINEGGDVVGVNGTHEPGQPHSQGPYHGVLWHGGSASDLGENVFPVKINDHGTYAGYVYVDVQLPNGSISNFAHAMLGPGRDIGTLFGAIGSSVAKDINNNGDVVGYSTTLPGNHAFLYSHGAMVDLNTMLAAGACWTLQEADAINDSGQIAGLGTPANDPSHTHGFLLTPTGVTVGIPHVVGIPSSFALYQNYPNPFNPSTTISYQLAAPSTVSLTIYDVLGREVQKLRNDVEIAGRHSVTWAASRFASGVYMVRLKAAPISGSRGDFVATERMLLVK
ncbi:MAG TPA: T9SS type A sorting domain-containing protein, partial [Bacteroidota bacterium]|nr:T9SS type A sorting domain-containing protein [Bacteroidota bacterium]